MMTKSARYREFTLLMLVRPVRAITIVPTLSKFLKPEMFLKFGAPIMASRPVQKKAA